MPQLLRRFASIIVLVAVIVLPALLQRQAQAHGAVKSQAQAVGDYTVEFEYSDLNDVVAAEPKGFGVRLLRHSDGAPVPFDSAIVIMRDQKQRPMAAGEFVQDSADPGSAKFNTTLPEKGIYSVEIRFRKSGQALAQANFNFEVFPPATPPTQDSALKRYFAVLTFIVGLAGGSGFAWVWRKINKK